MSAVRTDALWPMSISTSLERCSLPGGGCSVTTTDTEVSPDSVAPAGYDPETKRVAPFLNTDGRLIQIGPDGKYYELLTPQEAELYALGSEGKVTQFIGGEKVWRMIVDAATNQIVEAYTVGGHHWIYSDSGLGSG